MADATANTGDDATEIVLLKAGHRWVFRYLAGEEPGALRCIAHLAAEGSAHLDWQDATMLARQMGKRMSRGFEELS
jgi:hypothetical protein